MKYFKPEMWKGVNSANKEVFKKAEEMWEKNGKAYSKQLVGLKKYLGERNFKFIKNTSLHDSGIISFVLSRYEGDDVKKLFKFPLDSRKRTVEIKTLEAEKSQIIKLIYKNIFSVYVNFPEKASLFDSNDGLGDWGYDEWTLDENGYLQHEILFSSGATIKINFKSFDFKFLTKPQG